MNRGQETSIASSCLSLTTCRFCLGDVLATCGSEKKKSCLLSSDSSCFAMQFLSKQVKTYRHPKDRQRPGATCGFQNVLFAMRLWGQNP